MAILLLLIVLVKYSYRRTTLFLLWVLLAGVLIVTSRPFSLLYNTTSRQNTLASEEVKADAIVALGAGVEQNGELRSSSKKRLEKAIELHKQGLAPILVVTGASETVPDGTAQRMRAFAEKAGVAADNIITIPGFTTREEALNAAENLLRQDPPIKHILLVTQSLHLYRAAGAFRKAGFQVSPFAAEEGDSSGTSAWFSWRYLKTFLLTSYEYMAVSRYRSQHWLANEH